MPSWECPKCGSEEAYAGTELQQKVTGSGGGSSVGFIGNELGDSGITPMMGRSDKINVRSETVEVTVNKCKKCDTILGEKDKRYTQKELDQRRAQQDSVEANRSRHASYKQQQNEKGCLILFCLMILLVTFTTECSFSDAGSTGLHYIGFGEYTEYVRDGYTGPLKEVTRSEWFPWITISLIAIPFVLYSWASLKDKRDAKNRRIKPPPKPKKNKTFTAKNLSRCGDATAQLIDDNLVQIVGGTEEEQAACVKWVQENHPEYEIS